MENGWNLRNFNTPTNPSFGRVHNSSSSNCTFSTTTTTTAWDNILESRTPSTSRIDWSNTINAHNSFNSSASITTTVSSSSFVTATQALMVNHEGNHHHHHHVHRPSSDTSRLYSAGGGGGGRGSHIYFPDPHLMCLKLGKRHYFGDAIAASLGDHQAAGASYSITKKGKPYYDAGGDAGLLRPSTSAAVSLTAVPRCQVDGCNVALLNAKDYHRRHKVCEIHSKAPKVVVLGLEQRFCQQCSRFHAVSEFDESKRSCRRRLAGHNERRRKSSQEHSGIRTPSQVNTKLMNCPGRHGYSPVNGGCALSLLSSKNESWTSATDLPTRCSAALRELIAENRAAILARQLILDKDWHWQWQWQHHPTEDLNGRQSGSNSILNYQEQMATGSNNWERIGEADAHLTLDLMQAPNSAFGFLSMRGKSKADDQECPELWSSFGGAHVV